MKTITFILSLCFSLMSMAQTTGLTPAQHLEDYDFIVKYVEDNYAGFQTKVVDGSRADYEALKTRLRAQVSSGQREGWHAVAEYTAWFNDSHLKIGHGYYDESGNWMNWTEHFSQKKRIHYESQMDYHPMPVACKVTDKTFLIRFPTCDRSLLDKQWVKNSVKQFKKSRCENLIIDIRNNGGGADDMYEPYLKLLYDHEDSGNGDSGVEIRFTQQNRDYMVEEGGGWRSILPKLDKLAQQNPDAEFLLLKDKSTNRYKKADQSVKKAALIIDNGVASAGEQMILAMRACSNRTTIYGRDNTNGCLDYSNLAGIKLPNLDLWVTVPMSRRTGLPESSVDKNGIAPDVRINLPLPSKLTDNIDEWVIWVAEQLEKE